MATAVHHLDLGAVGERRVYEADSPVWIRISGPEGSAWN